MTVQFPPPFSPPSASQVAATTTASQGAYQLVNQVLSPDQGLLEPLFRRSHRNDIDSEVKTATDNERSSRESFCKSLENASVETEHVSDSPPHTPVQPDSIMDNFRGDYYTEQVGQKREAALQRYRQTQQAIEDARLEEERRKREIEKEETIRQNERSQEEEAFRCRMKLLEHEHRCQMNLLERKHEEEISDMRNRKIAEFNPVHENGAQALRTAERRVQATTKAVSADDRRRRSWFSWLF